MSQVGRWAFRVACGTSWLILFFVVLEWLVSSVPTIRYLLVGWSINVPREVGTSANQSPDAGRYAVRFEVNGIYLSRLERATPVAWPGPGSSDARKWQASFGNRRIHRRWGFLWVRSPLIWGTDDGAGVVSMQFNGYEDELLVPNWFSFGAAAMLPLAAIARMLAVSARRKRLGRWAREGRCLVCGYDLRASVGECPECGRRARAIGRISSAKNKRVSQISRAARLAFAATFWSSGGMMIVGAFLMKEEAGISVGVGVIGAGLMVAGVWVIWEAARWSILAGSSAR